MNTLKKFFDAERNYFDTCLPSIVAYNNDMLTKGCFIYAAVLTFYTLLTLATGQSGTLLYMYFAFDCLHAALCAAVLLRPKDWKRSYLPVRGFCLALEISILGFFALEGALVSRTQHSLYVPIAILLVQLLFKNRFSAAIIMNVCYAAVYAALSCLYKTPEAYTNDVYIAVATLISSCIGCFLITQARCAEGAALTKYETLSKMDMLSGVYNKTTFERMCQDALKSGAEGRAIIVVDVNGFKDINAMHGYEVGDEVLARVGFTFRSAFRESDVIGRFGSDEFAALVCPCADAEEVKRRVEGFDEQLSHTPFSVPGLKISCAAGAALGRESDDLRAFFLRAERAMQTAKSGGDPLWIDD